MADEPKLFHHQTAVFIAAVIENMPAMSGQVMEMWIKNPEALQKALWFALCPPEDKEKKIGPQPL